MAYATAQHIIDRYSLDELLILTDRDHDDQPDTAVLDGALNDATAEIDTYLASRYQLPLVTVPDVLLRLCVDIAMYRLAADRTGGTEERRKRYEDAERLLVRISKGDVSLGIPKPPKSSNGAVLVAGPSRQFKRGSFRP